MVKSGFVLSHKTKLKMKNLVLTSGLVGVGKSTIANAIAKAVGGMFVDVDDFKRVSVDAKIVSSEIDPPEIRWSYYTKALQHVVQIFGDGQYSTVVMDEVFHLKELRHKLEVFCEGKQIKVLWVDVKSSYETVKRRFLAGGRDGHILSTDEALRMHLLFKEVFEEFSVEDDYICLHNDNDDGLPLLDEVIKRICV